MNAPPHRPLPVALLVLGLSAAACNQAEDLAGDQEILVDAGARCESGPGCMAPSRVTCKPLGNDTITQTDPAHGAEPVCWELIPSESQASEMVWDLTRAADGGYLAAGEATVPQTRYGAALWKVSHDGRLEWSRVVSGRRGRIEAVEGAPDSGYIAVGWIARSAEAMFAWVLKLDASGALEWERVFDGGDRSLAFDVGLAQDGGYILAGSTGPTSGIDSDLWVARLDPAGEVQWQRSLGRELGDGATAVHQNAGGFLVGGVAQNPDNGADLDLYLVQLDTTGEVLWERTVGGDHLNLIQALEPTSDGGCVAVGHVEHSAAGDNHQGWVVKLDHRGEVEWERDYGDSRNQEFQAVQPAADGGYLLTGYAEDADSGIGRFWLLSIDAAGEVQWERRYGEEGGPVGTAVLQADDGSFLAAGAITGGALMSVAPWVFKIGANGECDPTGR